jgi:hypothetical protein
MVYKRTEYSASEIALLKRVIDKNQRVSRDNSSDTSASKFEQVVLDFKKEIYIFNGLNDQMIITLINEINALSVLDTLKEEGADTQMLYFVQKGRFEMSVHYPSSNKSTKLGVLNQHRLIAENRIVNDEKYHLTFKSLDGDGKLLRFNLQALHSDPRIQNAYFKVMKNIASKALSKLSTQSLFNCKESL